MTRAGPAIETQHGPGLRRFLNRRDDNWYVQIMQGDYYVTDNPREALTTVLGSCIAACIRDRTTGVGGMNHFLLPESDGADHKAHRFGVNAMEVLINDILKRGASRTNLQAKLFGGANADRFDVGCRLAECRVREAVPGRRRHRRRRRRCRRTHAASNPVLARERPCAPAFDRGGQTRACRTRTDRGSTRGGT